MRSRTIFLSFLTGNMVHAALRSDPVPKQDGPVIAVVGETYNSIVLNNSRDVVLYHYNPACGPCSTFTILWEEFGKFYIELQDQIVIAKINVVTNDTPELIEATPIVRLYPAGAKSSTIDYGGERDLEELATFVRNHGGNHVDILDKAEALHRETRRYEARVQVLLDEYNAKMKLKQSAGDDVLDEVTTPPEGIRDAGRDEL